MPPGLPLEGGTTGLFRQNQQMTERCPNGWEGPSAPPMLDSSNSEGVSQDHMPHPHHTHNTQTTPHTTHNTPYISHIPHTAHKHTSNTHHTDHTTYISYTQHTRYTTSTPHTCHIHTIHEPHTCTHVNKSSKARERRDLDQPRREGEGQRWEVNRKSRLLCASLALSWCLSVCLSVSLSGSCTHTITTPRKGKKEAAEKERM